MAGSKCRRYTPAQRIARMISKVRKQMVDAIFWAGTLPPQNLISDEVYERFYRQLTAKVEKLTKAAKSVAKGRFKTWLDSEIDCLLRLMHAAWRH